MARWQTGVLDCGAYNNTIYNYAISYRRKNTRRRTAIPHASKPDVKSHADVEAEVAVESEVEIVVDYALVADALSLYQERRSADAAAVSQLLPIGMPYQYSQVRLRVRLRVRLTEAFNHEIKKSVVLPKAT